MSNQAEVIKEKQIRIVGMKWCELGVDKDPQFLATVFLCKPGEDSAIEYFVGYLKGIDTATDPKGTKKVFKFAVGDSDVINFTHYAVPTIPK